MIHSNTESLLPVIADFKIKAASALTGPISGVCGFDGFIDTFIRMESPAAMAEFGPKVTAAAGIAGSYPVRRHGDKFGGNGPLFAAALADLYQGLLEVSYIGALGRGEILPVFEEALGTRMKRIWTVAPPAHSTCLEFTDGKIMLSDMSACAEVTWERVLECVGSAALDELLESASFISAVNWGKLPHAGPIWSGFAERLRELRVPAKRVVFFMDLAEFEGRTGEDLGDLLQRVARISSQCTTMLSLNLKEAWQLGELFSGDFRGRKDPGSVAELAGLLRRHIEADRVIIHPNDGAACAGADGVVYVAGPYCREPLISTGAGDNFGAGCLAAALMGLDDTGVLLAGNAASGYFVRSGRSPSFPDLVSLLESWTNGTLGERIEQGASLQVNAPSSVVLPPDSDTRKVLRIRAESP